MYRALNLVDTNKVVIQLSFPILLLIFLVMLFLVHHLMEGSSTNVDLFLFSIIVYWSISDYCSLSPLLDSFIVDRVLGNRWSYRIRIKELERIAQKSMISFNSGNGFENRLVTFPI